MKKDFADIEMVSMGFSNKSDTHYRVYKDKTNFVDVDAETAHEALQKSAVENPYKIERVLVQNNDFVDSSMLVRKETAIVEASQAVKTPPKNDNAPIEPGPDLPEVENKVS